MWSLWHVPKHSFMAELVMLGKLRTRQMLADAGICNDTSCLLCTQGNDDCLHLFFRCSFSKALCYVVMRWIGIRMSNDESILTSWKKYASKFSSKKM